MGLVYAGCITQKSTNTNVSKRITSHIFDELPLQTRADLAIQQEFNATRDPALGDVPRERLMLAYAQLKKENEKQRLNKAAIAGITWNERGPKNVGGRTRAIVFDLNDPTGKTVFAGSVGGGLWKTTDIFASEVSWTPLGDQFDNMAITSIAQDPVHPDTLYFGTGEGYYNSDAIRGDGIWRSLDGGTTWSQLGATTGSDFDYITKIIVDSAHNVLATTRAYSSCGSGGIMRSANKGTSWTKVSNGAGICGRAADIEMASSSTFYASVGIGFADGIYQSTDTGKTWSRVYNATTAGDEYRIELACVPGFPDLVYAILQKSNSTIKKMIKTHNGGTSWATLTSVSWQDQCGGTPSSDFTRGQAFYDLIVAIDPNDTTNVYIGGIDLFKTTNGGTSWTQVSAWTGCGSFPNVHADQHAIVFKPGNSDTMMFGNDGGLYLVKNGTSATPGFTNVGSNYNTTQYYACAIHPTAGSNVFLGGAQDNGSQQYGTAGINTTTRVTGGDGAFCHIDQDDPNYRLTSYVYNQYCHSYDAGITWAEDSFSASNGLFINPTDYDNDAFKLYSSYTSGHYLVWQNPRSGSSSSDVNASFTGTVTAVFCDPNTSNRVYFGTDAGKIYRVNSAATSPSVTDITDGSMPDSSTVSCIEVENGDADHMLATFSNYGITSVWETTNGGTSWTAVEGDLPDMPIRWCMFSPWGSDSALVATELGVWTTTNLNAGSTDWEPSNTGLANVRTDMLQFRASDSVIIAATHGRGIYSTDFFSKRTEPKFEADKTSALPGETVQFSDDSYGATSWEWDFNNDGNYESTDQNPTYAYGAGGSYAVKLRINGSGGPSLTKTDYIIVQPALGTPYTTSDGGDFESNPWHFGSALISGSSNIWELGAPSNAISNTASGSKVWKTDLDADIVKADYSCALTTPSFNFTASGTYTLSFKYRMEVAHSQVPIGVWVEYSTNAGSSWTQLGSTSSGGTNWYNTSASLVVSGGNAWSHTKSSYTAASHDVSSLAGNADVRFRIMLLTEDGWSIGGNPTVGYTVDGFAIDDFAISGPTNVANPISGIETSVTSQTINIGIGDSSNFYSSTGKLIATVVNQSGSHNFGATLVEIDNAGGTTSNFSTNTNAANKILSKTLKITPTTNNGSASVKISMYFTAAELATWKSTTGLYAKNIQLFKTTGSIGTSSIGDGVYPSTTIVDSTYGGSGLCVTGYFSNGFSGVGAGGGGGGSPGPLPVTLLEFSGERESEKISLSWKTAQELNNSHFVILRSVDNEPFTEIGQVNGNGTSNNIISYQYIDTDLNAIQAINLCYRLRQVDYDGAFENSEILCLKKPIGIPNFVLTPNPVKDVLEITINPWKVDVYEVEIVNLQGEVIKTTAVLFQSTTLDLRSLNPGLYIAILRSNNAKVKEVKFIKN